jgi:F420-non-reducing hydrogenase iron-sulfur subunit
LEQIGLQGRRVQMINLSSAMGGQFAFSIAELTAEIKQLGPNPLRNDEFGMRNSVRADAGE